MKIVGSGAAALALGLSVTAAEIDLGKLALKVMQVNGNGSIGARTVATDGYNNYYVCGGFRGRSPFGTNFLTTISRSDAFLAKYDSGQNCIWVRQMPNPR